MNIIQDIEGRLESAYALSPFDKGKQALENADYRIISLEQNAKLRMQEGGNTHISSNGNYTREGVIYVPKKGIFLTKKSSIMANAQEATNCHRNREEFYLNDAEVEEALSDSVKLTRKYIPTIRFADNEITVYAFGKQAKKYGQFLKNYNIDSMPVDLTHLKAKPFARQMWFRNLGSRSGLYGNGRDLGYDDRVRGVRESAKGASHSQKRENKK